MEHELRLVEMKGRLRIPSTCRFYHAGKFLPLSIVEVYLKRDGRDPWIQRSMMGEDLEGGWPDMGEYVVAYEGETSNTEFQGAEGDQQPWQSDRAHSPLLDQYHDVN
jgi:hypothetical protein